MDIACTQGLRLFVEKDKSEEIDRYKRREEGDASEEGNKRENEKNPSFSLDLQCNVGQEWTVLSSLRCGYDTACWKSISQTRRQHIGRRSLPLARGGAPKGKKEESQGNREMYQENQSASVRV